jgi:hypothetical protein
MTIGSEDLNNVIYLLRSSGKLMSVWYSEEFTRLSGGAFGCGFSHIAILTQLYCGSTQKLTKLLWDFKCDIAV